MTGSWTAAHLLSLSHGLAAALVSISAFYTVGLLLLPRRLQASLSWTDSVVTGLTLYVVLCWVATSARHVPVIYVTLIFGVILWGLILVRFRSLQSAVGPLRENLEIRGWLAGFCVLYVYAYCLVLPPAGAALLALPPDGALDLVTYARYARQVLTFGTANIDLATFEYLRSPASAFVLAWHSLLFLGDPLDAGMPLLFMMAALFGAIAVDLARSLFGLSWRVAIVIAAIAVCAPMFRWTLATYSLGELLSATSVFYLVSVLGRAAASRSFNGSLFFGIAAGGTLLFFSTWSTVSSAGRIVRGVVEAARTFSPLSLLGLPGAIPSSSSATDVFPSAALVVLPFVPVAWAAAVCTIHRFSGFSQIGTVVDRQLAGALVIYVSLGVIIGNVAVQAVSSSRPIHWPGAWRELNTVGRVPFQSFTLKVADQPNGLSTALSMYYMPGRKAHVIGRGVALHELPFENVSRQEPMFIHNFGCDGVGHVDIVPAPGVGCLLMAPPSMTVGTLYRLNRTYLFLDSDPPMARDPGGRWNTQSTLNLRMTADPQRAGLDREMYLNILVDPFLPAGTGPFRLTVQWGKDRRGEVLVGERLWFSLPVGSQDWSGNRLWTAPVAIVFPEGRTILFQEVALTESPRGRVAEVIRDDR
jgi:hypothetical protein